MLKRGSSNLREKLHVFLHTTRGHLLGGVIYFGKDLDYETSSEGEVKSLFVIIFFTDERNELFEDSQSFRLCLAYHLLYKANYILTFNIEKDKPLLAWCVQKIKEVDLG